MPALIICGNRTFVAGDDLRTFTFFAILLRIIQLIVLIRLTVILSGKFRFTNTEITEICAGSGGIERLINASGIVLTTYFCSSYITAIVALLLEAGIWKTSTRGTPVQIEKRACLKPLCHIKLFPMSFLRLFNMAMGLITIKMINQVCWCGGLAVNPYALCPKLQEVWVWISILVGSHFLEAAIVGIVAIYFFFKKTGGRFPSCISSERKWECCCRCCCTITSLLTCCLYGGQDGDTGDFADIAVILADYFDDGGTLDVVASDVVIGLRTLARVQKQTQAECRTELKRRVSFVNSIKQKKDMSAAVAQLRQQQAELEVVEEEEQDSIKPERLRLVRFQDEEMGQAAKVDLDENDEALNADESTTGRISLKDEEMGEVMNVEKEPIGRPVNSLVLGDDLQVLEEVAALVEEESDEVTNVLQRVGSEKTIRRRALVYNLHRTGGFLQYKPAVREVLSRKSPQDKLAIAEGARFMRFAMGIYYFRRYNTQRRACELCCAIGEHGRSCIEKGRSCVNRCRNKTNEMTGHDFLDFRVGFGYRIGGVLEARFLSLVDLKQTEIKYVQFGEGVARTPYCISVDHAWKCVVITIRGTEGLDDVVADLRMVPVSMEECGKRCDFDGSDYFVHSGMLACAEWIYSDLESHGIVDKLLTEPRHDGYTLRLTGHSLGAGSAAILSFMMRPKYPNLKCLCFCPPGCSVSENAAEDCKPFLTSYVLDEDLVPRISLESLENLRDDMLDMIARLKVTKFQATHAKPEVDKDMLLHREDSTPPSKFKEQLDVFHEQRSEAITVRDIRTRPLHPPGKIVQLVKTVDDLPPAGCCSSSSAADHLDMPYAARWAEADDFREIIISSHFLDDHSSLNVLRELERTAHVFGLSAPYTFREDEEQAASKPRPRRRRASLWRSRR